MNVADVRRLLELAGTRSRKQLGQHFLVDESVLETIVQTANVQPGETVVEIGPGLGVLTEKLVSQAGRLVAFELDDALANLIAQEDPSVEIVRGDVLKTAPAVLSGLGKYKVAANIPYQITTPLLRLLLESELADTVTSLTLLIQKEVAERLTAAPVTSGRGYLSVVIQYYADVTYVRTVPQGAFWPPPKVQSAVIHIVPRTVPELALSPDDRRRFFKFVHALFQQPRKQLKSIYAHTYHQTIDEALALFARLGFSEKTRAQELSVTQWFDLYQAYRHNQ